MSEYGAKAYVALLELGTAEARDIARLAKIPIGKVYAVLDQLSEHGLVIALPETPKRYVPVAFGDFLDHKKRALRAAADDLDRQRDGLLDLFQVVGGTQVNDRGGITLFRGRRTFRERFTTLVEGAASEVLLVATRGLVAQETRVLSKWQTAKARGVKVRFLLPLDEAASGHADELARCGEVRVRDFDGVGARAHVAFAVVDGKHACFAHLVPDDASITAGKDVAVFTDEMGFVDALTALIETHWAHARPVARRVER